MSWNVSHHKHTNINTHTHTHSHMHKHTHTYRHIHISKHSVITIPFGNCIFRSYILEQTDVNKLSHSIFLFNVKHNLIIIAIVKPCKEVQLFMICSNLPWVELVNQNFCGLLFVYGLRNHVLLKLNNLISNTLEMFTILDS